jgi:hypothetical protein
VTRSASDISQRSTNLKNILPSRHPSREAIELYALGRLNEQLVAPFEEHLLICEQCQDSLEQEDAFASGVLNASKRVCVRRKPPIA